MLLQRAAAERRALTIFSGWNKCCRCRCSDNDFIPSIGLAFKATFAARHGTESAISRRSATIRAKTPETQTVAR